MFSSPAILVEPISLMRLQRGCFVSQDYSEDEEETTTVSYNVESITSSTTRIALDPPTSKRHLENNGSDTPMEIDPKESEEVVDPMDVEEESLPSAPRGASTQIAPFIEEAKKLQETILSLEFDESVEKDCLCGHGVSLYRCLDCVQGHVSCKGCLVKRHKNNPFHKIEFWTGNHFAKSSLCSLDHVLHLGHFGNPCPNAPSSPNGRKFTVVHVNGVHDMHINFCYCLGKKSGVDQLLQCRLFPATLERPQTVFTFAFLDDFQIHNATSHKSMYDYYDAIRRKTDAAFPDKVSDRYREALRCNRVWAHLAVVRRTGQAHGVDSVLTHRRKGCLAVRCVACPEPGFNLDPKTLKEASLEERHKYTAFYSLDGNFRLQQALKNSDLDDVALNQGNAYFVPEETYQQYLKAAKPKSDTTSTCAHLNAVRLQNIAKFKGARVSGVVSVQCARHAVFMPQGTVDLNKGEEYARSDFALVHALSEALSLLRWIRCSYDLWCQYVIHLLERIKTYFPSMYSFFKKKVDGAIPKMHVKNHMERCQYLWSFNFMPHSGETCGESIETTWAELNQAAATTKEMNAGHRHDSLDAAIGHWNFKKVQTIAKLLVKRYKNCKARLDDYETNFRDLNVTHEKHIAGWSAMDTTFKVMEGGGWSSVYAVEYDEGERPPTQRRAYDELLEQEKQARTSKEHEPTETTLTELIQEGLEIEAEQNRLRALVSEAPSNDVSVRAARGLVLARIQSWRIIQRRLLPTLAKFIPKDTSEPEPENSPLLLPSSILDAELTQFQLRGVANTEMALREGACHDALERIRIAIQTFNHNCRITREEIFGQSPNTRAQAFLRTLKEDQYNDAEIYRVNREAFISLRYKNDQDASIAEDPLRPLHDKELWGKNTSFGPQLGDSKLVDPWFWYVRPRNIDKGKKKKKWALKLDCTKWHRHRAILDRCREEKEILIQEIIRTHQSFTRLASVWSALGMAGNRLGASCYAYKQAAMYTRFKEEIIAIIKTELKVKGDKGTTMEPKFEDIVEEHSFQSGSC